MRIVALVLAGVLAGACGAAAADPPASASQAIPSATILVSEGGILRPLQNGGRVPLRGGWATVQLTPVPLRSQAELFVTLFDAAGTARAGDISAQYESLDMDHGRNGATGMAYERGYRMPLSFEMPGSWKILVRVSRGGAEETITLVLPQVGY
jgi:hypothetical protein